MNFAQMVESVDTRDLKSLDHYGRAGSTPAPGTNSDIRLSLFLEGAGANVFFEFRTRLVSFVLVRLVFSYFRFTWPTSNASS